MIPRQTPFKRTAIRARKPKAASRRGPAYLTVDEWRNPAYRAYLRENGYCVACANPVFGPILKFPIIDAAHGPVSGMGQKGPDSDGMPLCRPHHAEQHRIGWPAFEAKYGFSRKDEAKRWWQYFQQQ